MATLKTVLREKQNGDGTFPIAIRITKNRKTAFSHLANIQKQSWDAKSGKVRKGHPNAARLNNFIATRYAEACDKALAVETENPDASAQDIKHAFESGGSGKHAVLFFEQSEKFLATLTHNRRHAETPRTPPTIRSAPCSSARRRSSVAGSPTRSSRLAVLPDLASCRSASSSTASPVRRCSSRNRSGESPFLERHAVSGE